MATVRSYPVIVHEGLRGWSHVVFSKTKWQKTPERNPPEWVEKRTPRPQDIGGRDGPPGRRVVCLQLVVDELELELTLDKAGCSRGSDRPRKSSGIS